MLKITPNNVIYFDKAKKNIEDDRLAAVQKELRQQDWFVKAEARLKKKREFTIALFVILIAYIIGLVAIMGITI